MAAKFPLTAHTGCATCILLVRTNSEGRPDLAEAKAQTLFAASMGKEVSIERGRMVDRNGERPDYEIRVFKEEER